MGVALLVLYFMAESKPKEATEWAFYVYVGATAVGILLDLAIVHTVSPLVIVIRALMSYAPLYKGMVAGAELQAMRDEEAAWLASKGGAKA